MYGIIKKLIFLRIKQLPKNIPDSCYLNYTLNFAVKERNYYLISMLHGLSESGLNVSKSNICDLMLGELNVNLKYTECALTSKSDFFCK